MSDNQIATNKLTTGRAAPAGVNPLHRQGLSADSPNVQDATGNIALSQLARTRERQPVTNHAARTAAGSQLARTRERQLLK